MVFPLLAIGFGMLAGALLAGDGQENVISNNFEETIDQSIQTTMKSTVNATADAACSNRIKFTDIKCCKINVDSQTCNASAVNDVVTTGSFEAAIKQQLTSQLKQKADAANDGFAFRQSNTVNLTAKRVLNLSSVVEQSFFTDCSKNAVGQNSIELKNIYCGVNLDGTCQDKRDSFWDQNFGPQTSTVSAVGSCTAKVSASSDVGQSLATSTEQIAIAKNTGIDFFAMFLAMIAPLMIFIFLPVGFKILVSRRWGKKLQDNELKYQALPEVQAKKRAIKLAFILIGFLLLLCILWYPGLGAYLLALPPYNSKNLLTDNYLLGCNIDGSLKDDQKEINPFMFYDKNCDLSPDEPVCNENTKIRSYNSCGIFAKDSICKSTQFQTDKDAYIQISDACDDILLLREAGVEFCNSEAIQNLTMRNAYVGCSRCDSSDTPDELFGLFSKIDPVASTLKECEITLEGTGNAEQVGYSKCTKDPNTCFGLTSDDTGQVWKTTGKTCSDKIEGNNTVSCINKGDCLDEGKFRNQCSIERTIPLSEGGRLQENCYSQCRLDNISTTKYAAAGYVLRTDPFNTKEVIEEPYTCGVDETNCINTTESYANEFAGECLDPIYMESKRRYSKLTEACERVSNIYSQKFGTPPDKRGWKIEEMCSGSIYKYLDCDQKTKECNYIASNTGDQDEVKACKNDFSSCGDPDFLRDEQVEKRKEANCKRKLGDIKDYDKYRKIIPIITGVVYGVLLVSVLGIIVWSFTRKVPPLPLSVQAIDNSQAFADEFSQRYRFLFIFAVLFSLSAIGFGVVVLTVFKTTMPQWIAYVAIVLGSLLLSFVFYNKIKGTPKDQGILGKLPLANGNDISYTAPVSKPTVIQRKAAPVSKPAVIQRKAAPVSKPAVIQRKAAPTSFKITPPIKGTPPPAYRPKLPPKPAQYRRK